MVRTVGLTLALTLAATIAQGAATVTFTNPDGTPSSTEPLVLTGTFNYRIVTPAIEINSMAIQAVLVEATQGEMAPGCYPMGNDQTLSVTSEQVAVASELVTVLGRSYSEVDCTGATSEDSNPILVRFVPESPILAAP